MTNLVAGSITTYEGTNPVLLVYDLDQETLLPLNIHLHQLDLDKADELSEDEIPEIVNLFNYLDAYDMEDLSPNSFEKLAWRIYNDDETCEYYHWSRRG